LDLRARLGLLFFSFLTLVSISVAATAYMLADQDQDAAVINQAGRQRMLVQRITAYALALRRGEADADRQMIADSRAMFDETLGALLDGGATHYLSGQTVTLPATRSASIRAQLRSIQATWVVYSASVDVVLTETPGAPAFDSALDALHDLGPGLSAQIEDVVRAYESESERSMARLRRVQIGFFACAGALLAAGIVVTRRDILRPLDDLGRAARRIGWGDLRQPVQIGGPAEIAALAGSFDAMRAQLKTSTDLLETRVEQRTRELTALYDVIREIASRLEIEHVLESVTGKARDLLRSDVAFICLLDESRTALTLEAHAGPEDAVCRTCAPLRESVTGQILTHPQAMICEVGACQTIAPRYRASHLAAPLHAGGRVIGALCVGSAQRATYSHDQVRLLTELANFTAIALENARLYEQAERVATLEERQRIAADMHDGLAQTLIYVRLKLEQAAGLVGQAEAQAAHELDLIGRALERANAEVRDSIASLRAAPQPGRPLRERIEEAAQAFAAVYAAPVVEVHADDADELVLPEEEVTQILRVVQEALQNVRRHAEATRVCIGFAREGACYRLTVRDDGRGFNPAANGGGHFGLSIMQARAVQLGGQLAVEAAPGGGTQVTLAWPAAASAAA